MTQTTHNDNLVIDGSRDVTQLTVEGAANQTTSLQKWQDGDQQVVAQVSSDGRFQIGNNLDTLRPPALVNIRRDRPAPIQGLSTQAKFSEAINTVLEWVSHKLELLGANGVSRRVSALRVQLTHNNSGVSADADLRAGDFEVVTQQSAGQAVAVHAAVTNQVGATLTDGMGVQIDLQNAGTLTNAYGLKIEDVDQGITNYAIQTGLGQVEFGGDVEVRGQLRAPTFTTTAAGLVPATGDPTRTSRYLKDDGTWATIGTFTTTIEGFVPSPGDATGRFLKDDGTWAAIPTADGGQSPWSTNRRGIHYDTGRVGIGTDNPREDLHVVGDICIDGDAEFAEDIEVKGDVRVDGTLSGPTFTPTEDGLVPKPGNATGRFLKDDGTWAEVTSANGGQSLWSQNGNDITYNDGNVGIGGTPSNRLEVVDGNVSVSQRTEGTSAWARVKANAAPAYLQLEDSSSDNLWQIMHDGENANKLKIDYFDGTAKTTPLQIEKSAPTNSVYIKSDGKVGIGTDNPTHSLTVNGPIKTSRLEFNTVGSGYKSINFKTNGKGRWFVGTDNWPESGSNAGSDLRIVRYADDGAYLGDTLSAKRNGNSDWGGNLTVYGNFSVTGAKRFTIDHPLKPLTHNLIHSAVEAPRGDLIYRGMVRLVAGQATINIDKAANMSEGTWKAFTRNPQVFLSSSDKTVDYQIRGNVLTITSSDTASTAKVGWLLLCERHDKSWQASDMTDQDGNLIVEYERGGDDRMNTPELYGQPSPDTAPEQD